MRFRVWMCNNKLLFLPVCFLKLNSAAAPGRFVCASLRPRVPLLSHLPILVAFSRFKLDSLDADAGDEELRRGTSRVSASAYERPPGSFPCCCAHERWMRSASRCPGRQRDATCTRGHCVNNALLTTCCCK